MRRPHPRVLALAREQPVGRLGDDAPAVLASAAEHRLQGLLRSQLADGRAVLDDRQLHLQIVGEALARERAARQRWVVAARIQQDLAAAGLRTAMLKGVTFEARWYDRLGERPSGDIDLWVDPTQMHRFVEVVRIIQPDHPLLGVVQRLVDAGDHQATGLHRDGIEVDLHADPLRLWTVMRCGPAVFARRVEVSGPDGLIIEALGAEDTVVHHLLHLNRDWFRSLQGYVDLARLVRRADLDWRQVWRLAADEGLTDVVVLGLRAVDEVVPLGTSLPPVPRGWRARAWQLAWPPQVRLQHDGVTLRYRYRADLLPLLARGRLFETVRVRWRTRLFPASEVVDDVYPGQRGPYLWRLTAGRLRALWRRRQQRRAMAAGPALDRPD